MFDDRPRIAPIVGLFFGFLASIALPMLASASGLSAPLVGTGRSSPVHVDATAVYWNPAALARLEAPELLMGGHLIAGDVRYERERRGRYQSSDSFVFRLPVPPEALDLERTGFDEPVRANPIGAAPTFFIAAPASSLPAAFGFGLYAPSAAVLSMPDDGPQRWQVQSATIATIHATAAMAWAPLDQLSFGASGSLVIGYAELRRVQDFAAVEDFGDALDRPPIQQANDFGPMAPPSVRELEVLARPFEFGPAVSAGFTFTLGALYEPTEWFRIGFAYEHGVRMTFNGDFRLDMDDPFFTGDLASQGLRYDAIVEGRASLTIPFPRKLRLGLGVELSDRTGLDLLVGWTLWRDVDTYDVRLASDGLAQPELGVPRTTEISVPRHWNDALELELTLHHRLSSRFAAHGRGGVHTAASPDRTIDMASPDGLRIIGGLGAELTISERWSLVGDVMVHHVPTRRVRASDFDLGNGRYGLTLVNVAAAARLRF